MSSRAPLYPRLLRLRHVKPNAWQRAALGEGAVGVAAVLVLADLATAWTLLALPLAVAVVVKVHDVLAGLMARSQGPVRVPQAAADATRPTATDGGPSRPGGTDELGGPGELDGTDELGAAGGAVEPGAPQEDVEAPRPRASLRRRRTSA